jgi:membrane protein
MASLPGWLESGRLLILPRHELVSSSAEWRSSLTIAWPTVRRLAGRAALGAVLRFVLRGGSYHAAALTYYSILSFFPAGALAYGLLGLVGAESVIDDAVQALEDRAVESQFVTAIRETLSAAVDQRADEARVAVVISIGAAVYVASRWVRGVARGLDAMLDRERSGGGVRFLLQLRDTVVLVLLFVAALVLAVVGGAIGDDLFGAALSFLWEVASFLLAGVAGVAAYAYVYAFVPSPPRPPRDALAAGALVGMLIWLLATVGFRIFADLWPGYDTNYGVFATLVVAVIWLWLTNVSVLVGGAFAAEWARFERREVR